MGPDEAICAHYERHALAWDADRRHGAHEAQGWPERAWMGRFADAMPAGAHVLDLGCGGGVPVAEALVARGCQITGIDTAPSLIALAKARLPGQTWQVRDMRGLQLGQCFDGVMAWDSFFHLTPDDQRAMFAVFAGHALPGACLMFNTGPASGISIGAYRGEPLYHASLGADEYHGLLEANGFTVMAHVPRDREAGGRTVWLARHTAQLDVA